MAKQNPIPNMIADLMVLDFNSDNIHQLVKRWKDESAVPFGQNCRRNLYYGYAEDFTAFPFSKLDRSYADLRGKDAYAHLLKFCLGFERGQYNTHNRAQFFDAWGVASQKEGVGEKYSRLLALLDSDTKFLHTHVTSHYQKLRHEVAARDLSGQKKGDDILVVGSLSSVEGRDELSPFTKGILLVSESKQKGQKDFITVTAPDPEVLAKLKLEIEKCEQSGALRSGITFVDFQDIGLAVETHNRVYVAAPMGSNEEAERQIIAAWQGRSNRQGTLTHMQGEPGAKGDISPLWRDAKLDNFVTVHDIRAEIENRRIKNSHVIVNAERACWRCAEFRLAGKPMNKDTFFSADAHDLMPEPA